MFVPQPEDDVLVSQLAGDPDLRDLIEQFVTELPHRLATLRMAACADNLPEVGRLAHQLKGAGGSYGFPQLSEVAKELERAARVMQSAADVWRALDWLTAVSQKTRAGSDC
jgi:histidine phosphotransfer protein HptB